MFVVVSGQINQTFHSSEMQLMRGPFLIEEMANHEILQVKYKADSVERTLKMINVNIINSEVI